MSRANIRSPYIHGTQRPTRRSSEATRSGVAGGRRVSHVAVHNRVVARVVARSPPRRRRGRSPASRIPLSHGACMQRPRARFCPSHLARGAGLCPLMPAYARLCPSLPDREAPQALPGALPGAAPVVLLADFRGTRRKTFRTRGKTFRTRGAARRAVAAAAAPQPRRTKANPPPLRVSARGRPRAEPPIGRLRPAR